MIKSESLPPFVTCWPCILPREGAASAIRNMPVCVGYRQDNLGMSELPSILGPSRHLLFVMKVGSPRSIDPLSPSWSFAGSADRTIYRLERFDLLSIVGEVGDSDPSRRR